MKTSHKPKTQTVQRVSGNITVSSYCGVVEVHIGEAKAKTVTLTPADARKLAEALRVVSKS